MEGDPMHISTRGRYGTRAMVTLADHYQNGFIAASKIAAEQEVSQKYLEKLLVILKKAGLVTSTKGVMGGYRLARPPQKICLREILESLGENFRDPEPQDPGRPVQIEQGALSGSRRAVIHSQKNPDPNQVSSGSIFRILYGKVARF
jgi:Rrf2 family protein